MSLDRTNSGNGCSKPLTNEEWLANGGLEDLAKEIIASANITSRVVTLIETLTHRVEQLELPKGFTEISEPLPEDFDLDDELNITDKGKEVLEQSSPTTPSTDIDLEEQVEEEREAAVSSTLVVETKQPISLNANEELRVTISQRKLLETLKVVYKAVGKNGINPLLNCIKLSIGNMKMTLTGTDGETWIEQQLSVEATGCGEILVPAKLLMETVKALPKEDLVLDFYDKALHIDIDGSSCSVATKDAEEFPELPQYSDRLLTALSTSTLKSLLRMTTFTSVKESSTGAVHYTNGILIHLAKGNEVAVVGTDGHRLALAKHRELGSATVKGRMLIPAKVAGYLEQLLPDDEDSAVSVFKQGEQVFFEIPPHSTGKRVIKRHPATLVGCRMIDVKFPEYERCIPKSFEEKVYVNREEFSAALKRCLMVCKTKDQNPVAHFETVKGMLTITADGGEASQAKEELACEGGIIKTALNPQYLLDVLKVLSGDDVILNWQSDVEPIAVTSPRHPDFIYIVMPIRMD